VAFLLGAATTACAAPCESASHREFDFWLGTWQVKRPDGKVVGLNRIESEYGGCAVHEHYAGAGGYRGESINAWDAARKVWHQTWVDSGGLLLVLEGGLRGGSMVLEGQTISDDGKAERQRITWTPNADGTVRQHWQSEEPSGQWKTVFDGLYVKQ
jgi:hypothetical protein